jgi:hypothetical protein
MNKIQKQANKTRLCKFKNFHVPRILLDLLLTNKKMYNLGYGGGKKGIIHHIIGLIFRLKIKLL